MNGSLKGAIKWARGRALRTLADTLPTSVIFQRGSRASRRIALTFDDGPGPLTREYLDVLDRAGARATFFVIGKNCAAHAPELEEMARRGHDVAGHGFSHTRFPELGRRALEDELERTAALLPPHDPKMRMVRPPYGTMTPRSLARCVRAGYTSAMWSYDPLDWDARSKDDVVRALDPSKVRSGDIVLLHEERRATLEALPDAIARLRGAGFDLVTVTELLRG